MKNGFVKSVFILSFLMLFVFTGAVFADSGYSVKSVQYSPNAQNLAIGDSTGDVCIYQISVIKTPFPYEPAGSKGDGANAGPGYTIQINKNLLQLMHGHKGAVNAISYAPNGLNIASGGADNKVIIWDTLSGSNLATLTGHTAPVLTVAYSPDNKYIASGSADGTIRIWDAQQYQAVQTIKSDANVSVFSLSFSNDGKYLLSGNSNNCAIVWSATDLTKPMQPIYKVSCGSAITSVAITPSNKKIVVAGMDGSLKLFDLTTGKDLKTVQAHTPGLQTVVFSVDGYFFASAGADKKIQLISVDDAAVLRTIKTSADTIYSLSFEPTGDIYIAAGSNDGAFVYNTTNGDQLAKLTEGDKKQ